MNKYIKLVCIGLSTLLLNACIEDDEASRDGEEASYVATDTILVALGAPDYSSPSTLSLINNTSPFDSSTQLNAQSNSNNSISTYGNSVYILGQSSGSVTKYEYKNPTTVVWNCSVNGASDTGTNANPYQLIHVSDSKAYILRYGNYQTTTGKKLWIVNPNISSSVDCDANFKTGEIDLSAFDSDGKPEMASAVLVGTKLFVAIQNLPNSSSYGAVTQSQVVVIDTDTDTVIDVDTVTSGTQAINLNGFNPIKITYSTDTAKLYVANIGVSGAGSNASLDVIDPSDYSISTLIAENTNTIKQITDVIVASSTQGFIIGGSFGNNIVYSFDPSGNSNQTLVATNSEVSGEALSGLAVNSSYLWVGATGDVKVLLLTGSNPVAATIETKMNPKAIGFVTKK